MTKLQELIGELAESHTLTIKQVEELGNVLEKLDSAKTKEHFEILIRAFAYQEIDLSFLS